MGNTLVVQGIPGREDMTRATVSALDVVGGAGPLVMPKVLYWTGIAAPSFKVPPSWILYHHGIAPRGHRLDFWRMLAVIPNGDDLIYFEDDVQPCRNAIPYVVKWTSPYLTTFCKYRRNIAPGVHMLDPAWGFTASMAIKIPAALVARMVDAGDTDKRNKPVFKRDGADTRIGRLLMEWGLPVHYHRSLFQHVGERSVCNPGARLTGHRAPVEDFDPDYDPTAHP